ncbi:cellulose biosynthesis cyclic di-GMP-binding regulatory protein BcsB [Petroclostridium sp. X23]|uniref:cellulose biosynthesis cyclic di-GMP-binding regulatory protein BcsB n=1 Tax=Petroclostridium sp. X23 TaxID=3045146 RepID=UPI0024AD87CC|nr:cellulose biosynthesis cyclic di-GMP-binding regulatory protein BcsB [Petroclostridium sp. X23]WHH58620.1 cellulose biosynthesis cyclic di-GMP-binding regulatory protein BcsB [Petroclostridium sp. X23]
MKKMLSIIIILQMVFSVMQVKAQTNDVFYGIQMQVFKNEAHADNYIEQLKNKGVDAYKISTSFYTIFYGIYCCEIEASQDVSVARQYSEKAHVVKLTKEQMTAYLNKTAADNKAAVEPVEEPAEESVDVSGKITDGLPGEKKQITINETPEGNLEYTYRVIDDIELRGVNGESKWFFNVDKDMETVDFKFNLFWKISELIRIDNSYFTVYMNDIPIKSMKIKSLKDELLNSWQINIPVNMIKKGYNELKVRTHSRITDEPCEDDKNIANWVIIDGNTNYVIKYDKVASSGDISDFPRPFAGMYADEAQGIGVAIPDDYTDKEISAALTLIAHMKTYSSGYEVPCTLITASNPSICHYDSLIYIGKYNGMPEKLKTIINNEENIYAENANIYRVTVNDGRKPIFAIVSDNGDRLVEAVKALNNSDLKAQMEDNYIKLMPELDTAIKEQRMSDYIYLNDLGINGIKVEGINQQVANIGLRIPSDQVLANESNISLNIRYSDNLDFDKSMVSVYVNGVPIGSQKMDRDKRDLHLMTFYMPESLRRNNYYDVRIVFELIPSGILTCEQYLTSIPWAYINADSYYYFPRQERRLMLLNNLPFPFSRNDDLDLTTIIIPDNPTREDFRIAGKIAELVGVGVKNNEGIIDAVKGSMFDEKYHDNNLIIFGTPEENSAIKSMNKNLWFQYDSQFSRILSNEKVELLPEISTTATFLELKTSPYNGNKGIMTITSLDKDCIVKAMDFLEDDKRGLVTGDAAIISRDGELLNFRFQKDQDERPIVGTVQSSTKSMRDYFIFTGALVLFFIIALGFYMFKNRKNK